MIKNAGEERVKIAEYPTKVTLRRALTVERNASIWHFAFTGAIWGVGRFSTSTPASGVFSNTALRSKSHSIGQQKSAPQNFGLIIQPLLDSIILCILWNTQTHWHPLYQLHLFKLDASYCNKAHKNINLSHWPHETGLHLIEKFMEDTRKDEGEGNGN